MTAKEYDHMKKVYDYVFSAPPNSHDRYKSYQERLEREKER